MGRHHEPIRTRRQVLSAVEYIYKQLDEVDRTLENIAAAYVETEPERLASVQSLRLALSAWRECCQEVRLTL